MKTFTSIRFMVVVAALVAIAGCATLGQVFTPANAPLVAASIDVAVAVAAGNDAAAAPARANVIRKVAQDLLAVDQGSSATVATVEAALNAEIDKLKLAPVDAAAAKLLTAAFTAAIDAQIQKAIDGKLTPDTRVAIATVLGQIIVATNSYAPA